MSVRRVMAHRERYARHSIWLATKASGRPRHENYRVTALIEVTTLSTSSTTLAILVPWCGLGKRAHAPVAPQVGPAQAGAEMLIGVIRRKAWRGHVDSTSF